MKIGERIKSRRLELGLSVDEVADKLGKNRATIYRYEKDDIKDLPITVLEPLAKVLETTPADLMGWGNEENFNNYTHYTGLARTYYNSVMHWSEELGFSESQTNAIREHFSDLLLRYKKLLERYQQTNFSWESEKESYLKFYSHGKKRKNANEIQASYIREDLEKQLQDLESWIDAFPDVVSRCNTDHNDELLLNAAHERTDTSITNEMKKHDDDIMDDENF